MFLKKSGIKKSVLLLVSLVLIGVMAVGGTVAVLVAQSDTLTNIFKSSTVSVSASVLQANGGITASIKNDGDIAAYVRAAIVVTWQNGNGDVYGASVPGESDYTLSVSNEWQKSADGFYYCTTPVSANVTKSLIEGCAQTANAKAPEGYQLHVFVAAEGIQSVPAEAVTDAWASGVSAVSDDGTLTIIQ